MTDDNTEIGAATRSPDGPAAATTLQPIGQPASTGAIGDFGRDAGVTTLREAVNDYFLRVRGGQVGALPALLGLVVLGGIFWIASPQFMTAGNLSNLINQAASTILIAMGLTFVLLLGEIDLAAGTTAGVAAGMLALGVSHKGNIHQAVGGGTYTVIVIFFVAATVITVLNRQWIGAVLTVLGLVIVLTTLASNSVVAMLLAVATGVAIGSLTGFLVSRVGIPSFVVTLALFLAWQGVLIQFIGEGEAIPTRDANLINAIENKYVPPLLGWIIVLGALAIYGGITITRSASRRRDGLSAEPMSVVLARLGVLTLIGVFMMVVLNKPRGNQVGMPRVVPIILLLLAFWTVILGKTRYGRHLYAVGGNAEAARRAGINVPKMRMSVFIIGSGMAALGGIAMTSQLGGVSSGLGAGNTLLFAVGAAVIGGTSLFGGRGRVRDAVIGGFVIAIIPNGLGLVPNLPSSYNYIITAIVLLIAASVDALSRRRSAAAGI